MDETISRQEAIDDILRRLDKLKMTNFGTETFRDGLADGYARIISDLTRLPSAERRGRWEHYEHREPQYDIEGYKTWAEAYKCSNCGFIHTVIEDFGHYAFCPNCGARMEDKDHDEE